MIGFRPHEVGVHLFEVLARGDSAYQFLPSPLAEVEVASPVGGQASGKARPERPLTVDDPLSAGVGVEAPGVDIQRRHLPLIYREW